MPNGDKIDGIYKFMKQQGVKDLPNKDSFKKSLKENPSKREGVYNYLKSNGVKDLPSFGEFESSLGVNGKKKDQSTTTSPTSVEPSAPSEGQSQGEPLDRFIPQGTDIPDYVEGESKVPDISESPQEDKKPDISKKVFNEYEKLHNTLDSLKTQRMEQNVRTGMFDQPASDAQQKQTSTQIEELKKQIDNKRDIVVNKIEDITKDVGTDELTMETDVGGEAYDPQKVGEKANSIAEQYGFNKNGRLSRLIENEIKAKTQNDILKPKVEKRFEEKVKEQYDVSDVEDIKDRALLERLAMEPQMAIAKEGLMKEYRQKADSLAKENLRPLENQAQEIKSELSSQRQQVQNEINNISQQAQQGAIDPNEANQKIQEIKSAWKDQAEQYSQQLNQLTSQHLKIQNEINSRINDEIEQDSQDLNEYYNKKLEKQVGKSPEVKKELKRIYKESYKEVVENQEESKRIWDDIVESPISNFSRSFAEASGRTIKDMASWMGADDLRRFGEGLEEYYEPADPDLKGWSDYLDMNTLAKQTGDIAATMLPSMAAAGATAMATGGLGAPASAQLVTSALSGWGTESMQIAGSEYEKALSQGDSFEEAEKKGYRALEGQVGLLPLYAFEGLPFMGKLIKGGKIRRVLTGGSVEYATEFGQEASQQAISDAIQNNTSFAEGFDKMTADKASRVALEIAPVAIMGGAPQLVQEGEKSVEQKAKDFAKSNEIKQVISEYSPTQKNQFFKSLVDREGYDFATTTAAGLYSSGQINESEYQSVIQTIGQASEINEDAKKLNFNEGQKKVYESLSYYKKDLQQKRDSEDSETVQKSYDAKIKEVQEEIDNLATNGTANIATIELSDGTQSVTPLNEAKQVVNDPQVQEALQKGEMSISVQARDKNETADYIVNKIKEIGAEQQEEAPVELTQQEEKIANDVVQDSEVSEASVNERPQIIERKYNVSPERAEAINKKAFGGEYAQETGTVREEGQETGQEQEQRMGDMQGQPQEQAQAQEETQEAEVAEQETQEQLDAQTVEAINAEVSEVEGIAQSISQLKEQNQQHFKKNGEPRKDAPQEVKDEYERLTNEYSERASQVQGNVEQMVKELENQERELSEQETQEINRQFEEKQKELIDEYGLSEDEVLEQSAEQKIEQGLTLTQKELEYANENFYKPEGFLYNRQGNLVKETGQEADTEQVSGTVESFTGQQTEQPTETDQTETQEQPQQTETLTEEQQQKEQVAIDEGYEGLDQAVNSVRKNLDKDVDRETITEEDIRQAAQESDSISEIQYQSEEQLVEEANEKLDQIEEGKSPAQLEVGGQKITQVLNNLSEENRKAVLDKYKQKQQQYQNQQEQVAEQKDEVAQAKENLNETFNKWLESRKGLGIANDPKKRAKEDVELMSALKNYAQALAARGVKNFNEFVKELPAKLKENLTNANLKEAWAEGKENITKPKQKGVKSQAREATGQTRKDEKITVDEKKALKQQIKREAKAAKEAYRAGKREQKAFSNKIKEIVKNLKGKLTPAQQRALINKAVSVNTERSLDNFVDYATNVIENAEYATEISRASKSQKTSRKKLKRNAYGVDDGSMSNALRVNPSLLSSEDLSRYNEFLKNINQKPFDRSQVEEEIDYFAKIGLEHRENAQKPLQEKEESEAVQIARNEAIQNFMQTKKRENVEVSEVYEEDYKALKNITENDLQQLNAPQIDELTQALNNLENDFYMSSKAASALREIRANRKVDAGLKASEGTKLKRLLRDILNPFGKALTGEKLTKANVTKRYLTEIPLSRIDSVFKGVKGTQLYKNFVEGISRAYSVFNAKSEEITTEFDKLYKKIKKNKREDSMVKLSLIALDKEYKNNPQNPETSPIEDYISAIQEAAKKNEEYAEKAERYVEIYQSMLNEQGEFDYVEQEQKLDKAEKDLLEFVENTHLENAKRVEVSAIRNGENITIRRYYTPLSVRLQEFTDLTEIEQSANQFGKDEDIQAVSKSGNIKARTKGAKPLHLEFDQNFKAAIRSTLRDYHMREPMREVSKAINKIKASEEISSEQRALFDAISSILEEITRNTFVNEYYEGGLDEQIKNLLKKRGYQMDLSSIPRAGVEFSTNMSHAIISKPKEFKKGAETLINSGLTDQELRRFVNLAGTTQFTRMFNKTQSIMAEQGGMAQESFTKIGKGIDAINNATQALPDRMLAKPVWIGSFMRNFKQQTGKEFDVREFNNSQEYRNKYQSAINTASEKADTDLTQGYASLNPYEGILAAQVNKDDGIFSIFNKYMTRFMKYEFQSLVDSWEGMIGRNELTKREGGALMAATITRMGLYQTALGAVSNATYRLIEGALGTGIEEDERKEEKGTILNKMLRGLMGSAISMVFFRRLGNWAKLPIAYGIETLNQKFGEDVGIREGEYDSYKKSLVFNPVPVDLEPYNMRAGKIVPKFMGPYSNFTKTSFRAVTVINRGGIKIGGKYVIKPSVEKEKTREKYHKELVTRILPEFYMETMGLPFPRDIRNLALREVFEEYRRKEKKEKESGGGIDINSDDLGRNDLGKDDLGKDDL